MRVAPTLGIGALLLAASTARAESLREIVDNQIVPLGDAIITFLFALAFVYFIYGVYRFFIAGGEEQRSEGKKFMLWGIIALAVMVSMWGFVRLFISILPAGGA